MGWQEKLFLKARASFIIILSSCSYEKKKKRKPEISLINSFSWVVLDSVSLLRMVFLWPTCPLQDVQASMENHWFPLSGEVRALFSRLVAANQGTIQHAKRGQCDGGTESKTVFHVTFHVKAEAPQNISPQRNRCCFSGTAFPWNHYWCVAVNVTGIALIAAN